MDNRWVIPYNPILLLRIKGHINIMFCHSTRACKYFYGNVLKGCYGKKVRVSIARKNADRPDDAEYVHDEIQEYKEMSEEMSQFGPYEAYDTIIGDSFAEVFPPVEVLGVHWKVRRLCSTKRAKKSRL